MKDHDWQFEAVDAETVPDKARGDVLTLRWRCAPCGSSCTTTTGTKTICLPTPTAAHAQAAGVDPDCDQATVDQVHAL